MIKSYLLLLTYIYYYLNISFSYGFYAKPIKKADGSTDMMIWELGIPGKEGTDWEKGTYKIKMRFSGDYPLDPPQCKFDPKIYHPNVFTDGSICIDILKDAWRPSINLKQIALGMIIS